MVITVVGSGGKTTRIFQLADMYRKQGKRVFMTTTTHMGGTEETLYTDDPAEICEKIRKDGYCMAGVKEISKEGFVKIKSLSPETLKKCAKEADVTLIEGDGSARLPVKFPESHEPVIPDFTDEIHVVTGLSAIGKTCKEVAHRRHLVQKCLGIEEYEILKAEHLQKLVMEGYVNPLRKKYPEKKIICTPGQVNTLYEKAVAQFLREESDVSVLKSEWFEGKPHLVICGAGHVGKQVAKIGKFLDFHVNVVDNRPEFASEEKLPDADRVYCIPFEQISDILPVYENAYYVVMTSGHGADGICVQQLLKRPHKYLGLMGSKGKKAMIQQNLRDAGFLEDLIASIYTPIGLSIGAVTPEEIAISIAAELVQVRSQSSEKVSASQIQEYEGEGVLCVVIEKEGYAPGMEGSMMIVKPDGNCIGTVGGGSLEAQVKHRAENVKNILTESYDFRGDTNCGGKKKILFVPVYK